MYCQNCGTENADGVKFCSNCGTPLGGAAPATAVQAAVPAKKSKAPLAIMGLLLVVAALASAMFFLKIGPFAGGAAGGSSSGLVGTWEGSFKPNSDNMCLGAENHNLILEITDYNEDTGLAHANVRVLVHNHGTPSTVQSSVDGDEEYEFNSLSFFIDERGGFDVGIPEDDLRYINEHFTRMTISGKYNGESIESVTVKRESSGWGLGTTSDIYIMAKQ